MQINHILFIHADGYWSFLHFLTIIINAVYKILCEYAFIFLGVYTGMEFLDYMATLYLTF
jgi:hypothetical protein